MMHRRRWSADDCVTRTSDRLTPNIIDFCWVSVLISRIFVEISLFWRGCFVGSPNFKRDLIKLLRSKQIWWSLTRGFKKCGEIQQKSQLNPLLNFEGEIQQQKLEESIQAYKNALKNTPKEEETRHNLALAQRMLQQQEEKQQRQTKARTQEREPKQRKTNKPPKSFY